MNELITYRYRASLIRFGQFDQKYICDYSVINFGAKTVGKKTCNRLQNYMNV